MNNFKVPFKNFYKIKINDKDILIKGFTDNEVKAIEDGIVYGVGFDKLYKNYLVVYNDINKTYISYLNFNGPLMFNIGDRIKRGDYIGDSSPDGIKTRVNKNCLCNDTIQDYLEFSGIAKNDFIIDYNCLNILDLNNKKIISINNRRVINGNKI